MTAKLKRQQIENGLDALLVKIVTEHKPEDLRTFRTALNVLTKAGYSLKNYHSIYEELKQDFEDYGLMPKIQ